MGMTTPLLASLAISAPAFANWEWRLKNGNNRCLGVTASGYIGQWPCTWNADQVWHYDTDDHLFNRNNDCIRRQHGRNQQGEQLVTFGQDDCVRWTAVRGESNFTDEDSQDWSLVLAIYGGHANSGAGATLWAWNGNPDQVWQTEDADGHPPTNS